MTVPEKLEMLRGKMREKNIAVYYIPTNDFHGSEYLCDYFKCREYMSGFDGSAGTLVVTSDQAGLWTDGRYFLQAESQLSGTGITLYKSGEDGVPSVREYLIQNLEKGQSIGLDGRMVSAGWLEDLREALAGKGISVQADMDLVGEIWEERPAISCEPVYLLDEKYAGQSRRDKLERLRAKMAEQKADFFVLTSLDDIAWLLNLRGDDIHCNPVAMSFLVVSEESVLLFAHTKAFSDTIKMFLAEDGVGLREYENIYRCLQMMPDGSRVMLDKRVANAAIVHALSEKMQIIHLPSPVSLWKAVKHPVEVRNIREAHRKDGVAIVKLLYWIKTNISSVPMSEYSVSEKLEEFRSMQENYLGPSFDTIAGYAENGAIVHYTATKESAKELMADNFLLLDMGGHYLEGTTDVTRTILLGNNITEEQKRLYTAVLRGNLNLAAAQFLYGCTGVSLDILARKPLWDLGYDYKHGTGHGVGYLLNVHEGPNAFRSKISPDLTENAVLEEGMVTSDEPGVYLAGKYGIRLENLILCVKGKKNEYGQFMGFEPLTIVPFEREAIDAGQMERSELAILNEYHRQVYEKISPYLAEQERVWLSSACAPIG